MGKVYITGDKHGSLRPFFGLAEKKLIHADDIILITGDASYVWDKDYRLKIETIEQLIPGTLAFIDGNHENFPLLESFPVTRWNGGRVHRIGERILHLMRGEIYEIGGERYFCFGGARTVSRYVEGVEGTDWWIGEEPSEEEAAYAQQQLYTRLPEIDYIITHEAPLFARSRIGRIKRIDPDYGLPALLEKWYMHVSEHGRIRQWYFGHMHVDQIISERLRAIHNNFVQAGTEERLYWA